jgi:membrane protein YqaA with SNARE-associated domain
MLQRLYDRTMGLAAHKHALWALAAVAFIESSVFPIPPDVLLLPIILADRRLAIRVAIVCTVASVLGGLLGYAIGYSLYETVGRPLLDFYGYGERFAEFQNKYNEWGGWIVAGAGLTPFPYKVITIASGVTQLDLVTFTVASIASRGLRFAVEAAILWYFGPPVRGLIERNLGLAATLFFVSLFGGFLLVRYVI